MRTLREPLVDQKIGEVPARRQPVASGSYDRGLELLIYLLCLSEKEEELGSDDKEETGDI